MYLKHFGFSEPPFSIAPNPRYLYMGERHQEALAHLLYGIETEGGFVLLTGEVGTGKTTLCRYLFERTPENCDLAFIFNPKLTIGELLSTICDELHIAYPPGDHSVKVFVDLINERLLRANAQGRKTVLVIDEAQNLSDDVLEQIRLLTNLETNQRKLLQVVLLAQPELRQRLLRPDMRQLTQRIVARYHLDHLARDELAAYVNHRLAVAGVPRPLFAPRVLDHLYRYSGGVPRLINVICDRALLGAFVDKRNDVNLKTLQKAAREVFGEDRRDVPGGAALRWVTAALILAGISAALAAAYYGQRPDRMPDAPVAGAGSVQVPASASSDSRQAVAQPAASPEIAANDAQPAGLEWPADKEIAVSEATAVAALFRLWGSNARSGGVQTACELAAEEGLRCMMREGSVDEVRDFNLAAVVMLRQQEGAAFFATLVSIAADAVTVLVNGVEKKVPLSQFERQWAGKYAILWRGPSGTPRPFTLNARGADVAWIARRLALAMGRAASAIPDQIIFDAALKRQVVEFQAAQGLQPDGVAGPLTLARLAALTESGAPRLSGKGRL